MIEKIVHTAKQTVKAMVDMTSACRGALSWLGAAGRFTVIFWLRLAAWEAPPLCCSFATVSGAASPAAR
ncbi:hypothetical protein [Mesorhizobium sp. LSHC420B00]|uniref:hypothetical protein n=1 Tax=Mesorhizobium sp. LSHC420B00 TaxID=1287292 RepID=UPI001FD9F3F4|nr:hypothetical protein [Mesorhizobium sp. LSHC420B00]